ncbi:MAG: AAA family ATPase, partial [Mycobacterium sp.]
PDPVVYTAHPLFAERARVALGDDGARRLRTELVTLLTAHPSEHVSDRLRLASLELDSDAPQPVDEVVAAAQQALRLGDLALVERLAASALDRGAGLPARLALAYALTYRGRGREADAVLSAIDPAQLSGADLMAWALPRAANQFFMLNEPERATAFLQTTRNRVADPTARITLDALSATFAMNAGNIGHAVDVATAVLAAPAAEDMAVAWAGSAAALCAARQGRFDDVEAPARRALDAEHPGLLRFTIGLGQTTVLLMAGRLDAARELAQQFTDFAELQQPGRAIGEVLVAQVLIAAGEFDTAAALLGPAAATLERTGYSWSPLSLMLLATAQAQQSNTAAAAKALSRAESRHGTKSALFAPELGVARAWRLASMRDSHGAVAAARDAARMAERSGQSAAALRAWHEAVRLGDIRAVDPLTRLCGEVDCAVGRLALAHA